MSMIVQKFGGSSLATPGDVQRCARLVADSTTRASGIIVVVSAMGRHTDELIERARAFGAQTPSIASDALLAGGEQHSAAIMTLALAQLNIHAELLGPQQVGITTDGQSGNATIRSVDTSVLLSKLAARGIVVVPGFQGIGPDGHVRTLGRGGSDTTAVALAAAVRRAGHACRCEIYSDVEGVRTADPHLIVSAHRLEHVNASWMSRYARAGAQVFHDRAAVLALQLDVPVNLGSAHTGQIGTVVHAGDAMEYTQAVGCTMRRANHVHVTFPDNALTEVAAALSAADATTIRWQNTGQRTVMTAVVDAKGRDELARRFGRSANIDVELQPIVCVCAVGELDASFRALAMQTHTRLLASIDALCGFELEQGTARWMAHASAAERLYARVHDSMVVQNQPRSESPLVEVQRFFSSGVPAGLA